MRVAVTPSLRMLALVRAFPCDRLEAGRRFFAEDLCEDGRRESGLRVSDLESAIAVMLRRGLLEPVHDRPRCYALTDSGVRYLSGGYRWEHGLWRRLRGRLLLWQLAQRRRHRTVRKRLVRADDH